MGRFYTIARLSPRIEKTPEGYLLCRDVPVARAGELIYLPHEVPEVRPGADGRVRITRTTDELHDPITLASMEGKPVTLGHPSEFLGPKNWKDYTSGIQVNVRPGEGSDKDKTLADLLLTDFEAIQHVEDCQARGQLPEISWGYDAAFEDLGGGRGRQKRMRGNHTALVRYGRNGREIAIRDEDTTDGAGSRPVFDRAPEEDVADQTQSYKDRLLARLQGRELTPDAVAAVCDELAAEDSPPATPVVDAFPPPKAKEKETAPSASPAPAPAASTPAAPAAPAAPGTPAAPMAPAAPAAPAAPGAEVVPQWAEALLAAMNKLIDIQEGRAGASSGASDDGIPGKTSNAPAGTDGAECDEERRLEDAAPMVDQETAAAAEILAPGIELDANVRQNALRRFASTEEGSRTLRGIIGGRVLDSIEGEGLDFVFRAAAAQVTAERRAVVDSTVKRDPPKKTGEGAPLRLNDIDATKLAEIHRARRRAA